MSLLFDDCLMEIVSQTANIDMDTESQKQNPLKIMNNVLCVEFLLEQSFETIAKPDLTQPPKQI